MNSSWIHQLCPKTVVVPLWYHTNSHLQYPEFIESFDKAHIILCHILRQYNQSIGKAYVAWNYDSSHIYYRMPYIKHPETIFIFFMYTEQNDRISIFDENVKLIAQMGYFAMFSLIRYVSAYLLCKGCLINCPGSVATGISWWRLMKSATIMH